MLVFYLFVIIGWILDSRDFYGYLVILVGFFEIRIRTCVRLEGLVFMFSVWCLDMYSVWVLVLWMMYVYIEFFK